MRLSFTDVYGELQISVMNETSTNDQISPDISPFSRWI